jgi:hypothetical protein
VEKPGGDAIVVAQTLGMTLEGSLPAGRSTAVRFASNGAVPATDPMIRMGRFKLLYVAISDYQRREVNEQRRYATGLLMHSDRLGRRIATRFAADYRLVPGAPVLIDAVELSPADDPNPAAALFFVPAGRVDPSFSQIRPMSKLLYQVKQRSVPAAKWRSSDSALKEYYVFAFIMDRLAQDAAVDLRISRQAGGLDGDSSTTESFQENGWHAAYARARFAINGSLQLFFKVVFTPGGRTSLSQRQPRVAAVFSSETLVKKSQRLLKALGYDPGPVDGLMGAKTRSAIAAFHRNNGLSPEPRATMALYRALLSASSGRKAGPEWAAVRKLDPLPGAGRFSHLRTKMWPNILNDR